MHVYITRYLQDQHYTIVVKVLMYVCSCYVLIKAYEHTHVYVYSLKIIAV